MLTKLIVRRFKRFEEQAFDLDDSLILAGQNNGGKTTVLQALAAWNLAVKRWNTQRGAATRAKERTGVAITRKDFTAVPLREMNLLWYERRVASGGERPGAPMRIQIEVQGRPSKGGVITPDAPTWTAGMEFQYQSPEMVYVRPIGIRSQDATTPSIPDAALQLGVLHVPPLSGVETEEPRRDAGYQNLLVGQGRPGEILRNLLLEVSDKPSEWQQLVTQIESLFGLRLLPPRYDELAQPFIVCEYEISGGRTLDIATAGSGVLQAVLLLAFIHARPASVILLDEPDAHLHVILQRQVYDLLRKVAREHDSQLIIATHSEVILDATDPGRIISFAGRTPRRLINEAERDSLREAINRLTSVDLLLARQVGAVLYVESATDEAILREWARILQHPAYDFLKRPYVHHLRGRSLPDAKGHFFALKAVEPAIPAVALLDGDNLGEADEQTLKSGLKVLRWRRYEIENYLLVPSAIRRYVGPLYAHAVEAEFRKQVPEGTNFLADDVVFLRRTKASEEFLVPALDSIGVPTPKSDLYKVASQMRPDEIHPEVREKLDAIRILLK